MIDLYILIGGTFILLSLFIMVIFFSISPKNHHDGTEPGPSFFGICLILISFFFYTYFYWTTYGEKDNYITKTNIEFIKSNKYVYSLKEAEKLKIINDKYQNSYFLNLAKKYIKLDFRGNVLVTQISHLDKFNCKDIISDLNQSTVNDSLIMINNKTLPDIVKSTANIDYECSLDSMTITSKFTNNKN